MAEIYEELTETVPEKDLTPEQLVPELRRLIQDLTANSLLLRSKEAVDTFENNVLQNKVDRQAEEISEQNQLISYLLQFAPSRSNPDPLSRQVLQQLIRAPTPALADPFIAGSSVEPQAHRVSPRGLTRAPNFPPGFSRFPFSDQNDDRGAGASSDKPDSGGERASDILSSASKFPPGFQPFHGGNSEIDNACTLNEFPSQRISVATGQSPEAMCQASALESTSLPTDSASPDACADYFPPLQWPSVATEQEGEVANSAGPLIATASPKTSSISSSSSVSSLDPEPLTFGVIQVHPGDRCCGTFEDKRPPWLPKLGHLADASSLRSPGDDNTVTVSSSSSISECFSWIDHDNEGSVNTNKEETIGHEISSYFGRIREQSLCTVPVITK